MTDTSDLTNAGEVVEALGQAWTLSHVGPALRGKFSAWLKGRARQELTDQRRQEILQGDDYKEALSSLTEEMAAGSYNWGSPLDPDGMGSAVRAALGQTEGKVRLVQLLLEKAHGTVPPDKVLSLLNDNPEGMAGAIKACLDPNRQAPVPSPGTTTPPVPTPNVVKAAG